MSNKHAQTRSYGVSSNKIDLYLRRRLLKMMGELQDCQIILQEQGETQIIGQKTEHDPQLKVHIHVHDLAFYRHLALHGSVGAGESYMQGMWTCNDLVALVRIMVRNRDLLDKMETGTARLGSYLYQLVYKLFERNTKNGSKRNIAAHYDLGNDLFSLFLDKNLMYSSGLYLSPQDDLETAAERKLARICEKMGLTPDMHIMEIGTGWGGFALYAAQHYGCHVTTTTISQEQYHLAKKRVAQAGLSDKITLLLQDYRDLTGHYDRVVSIEMIEAIGHQYLNTYFNKISQLLNPKGMALIQAITIEDHRYQLALNYVDFIKRYIFPGGFLPSVSVMAQAVAKVSNLTVYHLEDIGASYALTLNAWRTRFLAQHTQVKALGYDERFIRMWEMYMAYCEGGFIERSIGTVQLWLTKPGARPVQFTPHQNAI